MGQEYFINSQELQNKVNSLLPSQVGAGAGFDLSASTQIVPIIDLTESAQGSNVPQDLQTAYSHTNSDHQTITNTTTTLIVNTGYWRILASANCGTTSGVAQLSINDGSTSKTVYSQRLPANSHQNLTDFIIFLGAGDSFEGISTSADLTLRVTLRQIADIEANLISPT